MATAAAAPSHVHTGYQEESGIWSWLTTVDHKRIGALYLYTALAWFAIGALHAIDKNGVAPQAISLPSGPGSIQGLGESFQPQLNTGSGSTRPMHRIRCFC